MNHPQTALIAGASSGVGAATARALADLGMDVALIARRADRLERLAGDVRASGRAAHALPADLARSGEADRAMGAALAALGSLDVLVYAAGINVRDRRLDALSIANWDAIIAANLSGAFYCVHAALPAMRARGRGLIVFISSVAASRPSALSGAAYSASKAGLNALATCINLEESDHGIRACTIEPGDIDTDLLDQRPRRPTPEQRTTMLRPEDIASLVAQVVRQPPNVLVQNLTVRPWRE